MRTSKQLPVLAGLAAAIALSGVAASAHAWSLKGAFSSATSWVSNKASAATSFAGNTYNSVKAAASSTVNKAWDTATTVAKKTYDYAAEGAKKVQEKASAGYQYVKEKGKQAGQWVYAQGKKAYDTGKKAVNWAKDKGKQAYAAGKKAVDKGIKAVKKGMDWARDKLNVINKYGGKILAKVKAAAQKYLAPLAKKFLKKASDYLGKAINLAKKAAPAVAKIEQIIKTARTITDAVQNPQKYIEAGKAKLVDYLADVAMRVLRPYLVQVNGYLVGLAMKVIKSPVSQAIATALSTAIASAVAAVTAGAGAVLQPVLQPLTKWTADRMLDWAIDKVKDKIAELVFEKTRGLMKQYIIKPAVNWAYDKLVSFLKQRFPNAFKKAQDLHKKAKNVAGKVDRVLDVAEQGVDAYHGAVGGAENLKKKVDKANKSLGGKKKPAKKSKKKVSDE